MASFMLIESLRRSESEGVAVFALSMSLIFYELALVTFVVNGYAALQIESLLGTHIT